MRATIQEVTAVGDSVPVAMAVTANPAADHSGGRVDRWQVVTLTDGRVSDIRGFEDRPSALAHASHGSR